MRRSKLLLLSMLFVLILVLPWLHKIQGQEVSDVADEYRMDVWLLHGGTETHCNPTKAADGDQEGTNQNDNTI